MRPIVALLTALPWLLAAPRLHGSWGVAFAPSEAVPASSAPAARPAIVYLHGMWASPEDSCGLFERSATAFGFLVCPRGNAPLGEGKMWKGTYASVAPNLHAALGAAAKVSPIASSGGTLMGYSNGAYFAAEIAMSEPGRWTSLVLLSMRLELDVPRLRTAGIQRIVLGAADKDAAHDAMSALVDRTSAAGLPARFVSLGPGSHELPDDLDARLCEPLAWSRQADPAACRAP